MLLHGSAKPPMLLLWGYLAYWLVIVWANAHRTTGTVWLTAVIISAIVGTGINAGAIGSTPLAQYLRHGPFRCARFYGALIHERIHRSVQVGAHGFI